MSCRESWPYVRALPATEWRRELWNGESLWRPLRLGSCAIWRAAWREWHAPLFKTGRSSDALLTAMSGRGA